MFLTSSVSCVSSFLFTGCPAPGRKAPIGILRLAFKTDKERRKWAQRDEPGRDVTESWHSHFSLMWWTSFCCESVLRPRVSNCFLLLVFRTCHKEQRGFFLGKWAVGCIDKTTGVGSLSLHHSRVLEWTFVLFFLVLHGETGSYSLVDQPHS